MPAPCGVLSCRHIEVPVNALEASCSARRASVCVETFLEIECTEFPDCNGSVPAEFENQDINAFHVVHLAGWDK